SGARPIFLACPSATGSSCGGAWRLVKKSNKGLAARAASSPARRPDATGHAGHRRIGGGSCGGWATGWGGRRPSVTLFEAGGRRRLAELADAIAAQGHKRPLMLPVDLAAPDAVGRIADAFARLDVEPETVVNNAGFGLVGAAAKLDLSEQLAMIDVNVRVLTDLSLAFVDMLQRHRGGILNVASVAGFLPGPGMAIYYASKAYVLSFSEALHRELKPRGVRVTVLCPGPVRTEFQARAGVRKERYPSLVTQTPEQVAQAGYRGLM